MAFTKPRDQSRTVQSSQASLFMPANEEHDRNPAASTEPSRADDNTMIIIDDDGVTLPCTKIILPRSHINATKPEAVKQIRDRLMHKLQPLAEMAEILETTQPKVELIGIMTELKAVTMLRKLRELNKQDTMPVILRAKKQFNLRRESLAKIHIELRSKLYNEQRAMKAIAESGERMKDAMISCVLALKIVSDLEADLTFTKPGKTSQVGTRLVRRPRAVNSD